MEAQNENPFAVVTGASTGIGLELARQFAMNGFDLIIASDSEAIFEAQDELLEYGTNVECLETNLATYNGVELLAKAIRNFGRPLDAIAINAGVSVGGPFHETNLRNEINLINLNVISAVHLTKCILQDMYDNGHGKILFTSSINATMPAPDEAVYAGSKAFISSFAEAIRNEAREHGVSVTMLQPEAIEEGSEEKFEHDPADVARQAFEALMAGQESVFSASLKAKLQGWAMKFLPEGAKATLHRKISELGSAKH